MSSTAPKTDRSDAGFTIVEMLVALALFGVLATVLFSNLSVALKAFQSGSAHALHAENRMIAQDLLRRTIRDAYPLFLLDGRNRPHVDFTGGSESMSFLANAPMVVEDGGRHRFNLFIDRRHNKNNLVLTSVAELTNHADNPTTARTVVVDDIDSVLFSYFGTTIVGQAPQWHDEWVQQNELPKLIRIQVAFPAHSARLWPDLIVAPRVSVDVSCTYDPVTTRCRGR